MRIGGWGGGGGGRGGGEASWINHWLSPEAKEEGSCNFIQFVRKVRLCFIYTELQLIIMKIDPNIIFHTFVV